MTYEIYRYIFLGGAILSGVMFVTSVVMFILLKIPTVIGDLTGANARKAIANIRLHNENTGEKTYRTSQVNRERGKLTDKISASGRLENNPSRGLHGAMATEKISTQQLPQTEETSVLCENNEQDFQTAVLDNESCTSETTLLDSCKSSFVFSVEYEITYIHTNEVIR